MGRLGHMLTPRQRVILRQIVSPPYIYRWAGLLTTIGLMVGVTVVVLSDLGSPAVLATGPAPARPARGRPPSPGAARPPAVAPASAGVPARSAEDAPARGMPGQARPAITSSLLSVMSSSTDRPTVALTFDDGPTAAYTPQVLDLLAEYRVPATFCMVGNQAVAQPGLVQRVVAAGHRLCDHTFTHDATVGSNDTALMSEQLGRSH